MKLNKLLENIEYHLISGNKETEITSIEYDSRKVVPGSFFVCMKGFQSDGHLYAGKAIEQGAAALLIEDISEDISQIIAESKVTVIQVKDTRLALAYISASWFDHPALKMTMIALTGTKGKTTTSFMIKKILEEAGKKVGVIGTTGAYIGEEKIEIKNTTPESFELHALFSRMYQAGCTHVIIEASSQGFKLNRTAGICFDYGAFLNISIDHISPGEHETFEEYLECKKMLFQQTKKSVVNLDTEHIDEIMSGAVHPFTVSAQNKADLMAANIKNIWEPGLLGTSFTVSGACSGQIVVSMPGVFNVENTLIAIAVANLMGIDFALIESGLRKVAVKGRAQVLKVPPKYPTVIIDYAHNALSMESILHMLKSYHPGRLICLFGGGGNRPKQRRYDMGLISGKYADLTVITTDNPRFEALEVINEHIVEGLNVHQGEYLIIPDRKEAIHYLLDNGKENDIIALIGKGHEEYQDIQGLKYYFSEEKTVEEYFQ